MITLAEAKVGMADKVDQQVVDEFRRNSILLDSMEFDDAVSPTGGSTLAYGYMRLATPSVGGTRKLNAEYTAQEAKREEHTSKLKIFGGSFQIDRVIANTSGAVDEVDFQLKQKILGTTVAFNNAIINGDESEDETVFDGLSEALLGSNTEINTASHVDLSSSSAMDSKTLMSYKSMTMSARDIDLQIGDVIAGRSYASGLKLQKPVVQKIINVSGGMAEIQYKVEGEE